MTRRAAPLGIVPGVVAASGTNAAVFQPEVEGVTSLPTAEFRFLEDVRRVAAVSR